MAPLYVYECENESCQHRFEVTHPIAEMSIPKVCPECGEQTTKRVPYPVTIKGAN